VVLQANEEEVLNHLSRELEPLFRKHLHGLHYYYRSKFQDNYTGLYLPVKELDKESKALSQDVMTTFTRAAQAAVPPQMVGKWVVEGVVQQLQEEIDEEIADRRLEVSDSSSR